MLTTRAAENRKLPLILDGKFYKVESIDDASGKVKAMCLTCQKSNQGKLISGSISSTSNYLLHLKRAHANAFQEFEKMQKDPEQIAKRCKQSTIKFPVVSTFSSAQAKADHLIMDFIVQKMEPLNTVDNEYFRRLITGLNPEVNVMCSASLKSKLQDKFVSMRTRLSQEFRAVSWICCTSDIWSTTSRSFIGVTAHWLTSNFQRKSAVLSIKRFAGAHSHDKIAEVLTDIFETYKIRSKIIAVVTDNGSNFVKAFKVLGIDMDDYLETRGESDEEDLELVESQELEKSLPPHLRCASHTLSLIATKDIEKERISKTSNLPTLCKKTMRTAFAKCTTLWNKAGKSVKLAETVQELFSKSILRPVPTRWNSLYDAIRRLLSFEENLNKVMLQAGENLNLTDTEILFLREYELALAPVARALDILQTEQEFYYGYFAPVIIHLLQKLREIDSNDDYEFAPYIAKNLLKAVESRFETLAKFDVTNLRLQILSSCTLPCFKLRWVPENFREAAKKLLVEEMKLEHQASAESAAEKIVPSSKWDDMFSGESINSEQGIGSCSFSGLAELETIQYLNDERKSIEMLDAYPTVKKIFLKFNTPLPSSAPCERLFSYGGMIMRPKRSCLNDDVFELLVLLKLNGLH